MNIIIPVCVCHHCTNRGLWRKNNAQNYQLLFTLISELFHQVDYNIFTREYQGLVLNWQTIPRHLSVQPVSIYLKLKAFITRFH